MAEEGMNSIFGNGEGVVFINKFYATDAADQEWLIQDLANVTETVIRYQPGFISATVHKGFDDFTVTNYARWRSVEDFKRALQTPEMLAHRKTLGERYRREGSLGSIVYTYTARPEDAESGVQA
jgi:heme-degrading monooxygenase HmoA